MPAPGASLLLLALAALLATATDANADTAAEGTGNDCALVGELRFVESTPRDRFEFDAASNLGGTIVSLQIDLAGSAAGLLFDTEDGGDGVAVFQPLRVENAPEDLKITLPDFAGDGATRIDFRFDALGAGERFAFSIDVDDTSVDSTDGTLRVAGAEIAGATATIGVTRANGESALTTGQFDAAARLLLCW